MRARLFVSELRLVVLEVPVLEALLLAEGEPLPADAAPDPGAVGEGLVLLGLEGHGGLPGVHHLAPVAGLGGRRQVPVPEHARRLGGDALRLVLVLDQHLHRVVEVGPIALDLDVILRREVQLAGCTWGTCHGNRAELANSKVESEEKERNDQPGEARCLSLAGSSGRHTPGRG